MPTEKDPFAVWDAPSEQQDFLEEAHITEEIVKTVVTDTLDPLKKKEAEDLEKEEEISQEEIDKQFESFSNPEKEEELEKEEDDDKGQKPTTTTSLATLKFLKDRGLVEYEEEEGKVLTEEEANDLIEDSWDKALEVEIEATMKDLPNEVKDLVRYASKGGDVGELLGKMIRSATSPITKASDISKEETQEAAVTLDLKNQGYDNEEIADQIEYLKEKGKLEAVGTKAYNKIIATQEEEITNSVKSQQEELKAKKERARTYKANLTTHISSLSEVSGITLSKQDKSVLPSYISDPTVEMKDGRFVSELQADIYKAMGDKDKIVLLAKVIKSDFDFSSIERKKETAAARNIRNEIQRADKDKTSAGSTSKPSAKKKSVWEMLD